MTVRLSQFSDWLVGSLRTGLVGIDEAGAVTALSADAARVLGCGQAFDARLLGRPCREVLAAQPRIAALLLEALDGRERSSRAEVRLEPVAGRDSCTVGYTLVAVRDDAGTVRGAAMLFRDLTPFERMDEQARLHERLLALGQMAAGLAHEIRNPLASMEVLAGLLKRQLRERPEEISLVEELLQEIRTLAATVTASLDFVRPLSLQRECLDPGAVVDECVSQALARVPFEGRVERSVDPAVERLEADRRGLRAALLNVIVNALQAMTDAEGSRRHVLEVRVEPDREVGGVSFAISDTGPGIPEELRGRIFHPFFTTREEGTGVGLAEAQKVVASHGGFIELAARPGGGSTFRLRLPGAEPPP